MEIRTLAPRKEGTILNLVSSEEDVGRHHPSSTCTLSSFVCRWIISVITVSLNVVSRGVSFVTYGNMPGLLAV